MKIKRTLAILLTFVMVLGTLPCVQLTASADDEGTEYDIWILGTRLTSEVLADTPDSWGNTTYDPETKTLTLDLVVDTVPDFYNYAIVYTAVESLNICGNLEVKETACASGSYCGIKSDKHVHVADELIVVVPSFYYKAIDPHYPWTLADHIVQEETESCCARFTSVKTYDLWILGTRVTAKTLENPPEKWRSTTYDPETNSLTLDDLYVMNIDPPTIHIITKRSASTTTILTMTLPYTLPWKISTLKED